MLVMTFLSACATEVVDGPRQQRVAAVVLTSGPGVLMNGRPVVNGTLLRRGMTVTTLPGSSICVQFSNGAEVQLGEGSDPVTISWTSTELTVHLDDALLKVDSGSEEDGFSLIKLVGKLARTFVFSTAYVEEDAELAFRADLIEGEMQLREPLAGPRQQAGEYALVTPAGGIEFGTTSAERLAFLRERFERWEFTRPEALTEPDQAE